MGAFPTLTTESTNTQPGGGDKPHPGHDVAGECIQTLSILIFRGHPRDSESTRTAELYITSEDDVVANTAYRLEGQSGCYWVKVSSDPEPPHARPHYLRQFHVATTHSTSPDDRRLHNAILEVAVDNDNPEFGRFNWIGDVVAKLSSVGIITVEEGDEVVDQTINAIYDAPYPNEINE